MDKARKWRKSA